MDLLCTAPPPAVRWSVQSASDDDGRPLLHVVPPPDPGLPWPVLVLDHRHGDLWLSATTGPLPGHLYFTLPDPLRRRPIASLRGRGLPETDAAAETAVGLLAAFCGPEPAKARAHLSLLSAVAATLAGSADQGVALSFPDGHLLLFHAQTKHAAHPRRRLRLPHLAGLLRACPLTRGTDLDRPGITFSPIPVPQSAHARAEAAARLSAALADGPDGLSPNQILEALSP